MSRRCGATRSGKRSVPHATASPRRVASLPRVRGQGAASQWQAKKVRIVAPPCNNAAARDHYVWEVQAPNFGVPLCSALSVAKGYAQES
eukprot:1134795-Prymnesium_polylepis.1